MQKKQKMRSLCRLPPESQSEKLQKVKKTKRVYMPMHKIEKKSECGCKIPSSGVKPALCELEQNKNEKKTTDQNYLSDSQFIKKENPTNVAPTTSPIPPSRN